MHRVLFIAEAVTLAHVGRPIALASGLDPRQYEIILACDPRYEAFLKGLPFRTVSIRSLGSDAFMRALARGSPLYSKAQLRDYVRDDLQLIDTLQPDVLVGDFRLSLSVSARLARVPYISLTNAYWSPHFRLQRFPLPVLPITKHLPLGVADAMFRAGQPIVMRLHCRPLEAVRREHGLPSLGGNLRRVYTDADETLYADTPEVFPIEDLPASHAFLGPVQWSPPVAFPHWWDRLPADRPIIYFTLGSSGPAEMTESLLAALATLPVTVIASTAGRPVRQELPENVFVAPYLPGLAAAARARLVVCNGGSPTSAQALAGGVPVLGIASNMDQFLNMEAIEAVGAGRTLRADRIKAPAFRELVHEMMQSGTLASRAAGLSPSYQGHLALQRFAEVIQRITGSEFRRLAIGAGGRNP